MSFWCVSNEISAKLKLHKLNYVVALDLLIYVGMHAVEARIQFVPSVQEIKMPEGIRQTTSRGGDHEQP